MRKLGLAIVAALLVSAAPLAMIPARAEQSSQAQQSNVAGNAYDAVASCLRERGHLLLLTLIDESGSLRGSDPDNRRVAAIRAALRSFALFGRGPNSSDAPKIELLLAAFGTGFSEVGPWGLLNKQTLAELEGRVDGFAGRNQGRDTDFAMALDGARAAFAKKEGEVVQSGAAAPCRLLLVFTDGQHDIDSTDGPRKYYAPDIPLEDDARVEEAGRRFLCDPGGVADQLRATETVMVAVALRPDKPGPGGVPDQSFLRGLAEAQTSGGVGCGQRTSPPGALVEAQGLGQLLEAFDSAVVQALGGTSLPGTPETGVCAPAVTDARCVRSFELDTSLSEFHILVDLFQAGIAVEIAPPGGAPERLTAGIDRQFTLGGATLDVVSVSPLALVIDGSLPQDDKRWAGTWTVRFVDESGTNRDAVTRSQITVFGGLTAVVDPIPKLRAGEQTQFSVKVIDAAGSPRTPVEFVRSATVQAAVVTPDGERDTLVLTGPRADGSYATSYAVPAESTDPSLDLVLTLNVTTRGGLALRPRVQTYLIPVQPPTGYPLVTPAELVLSPILDEGEASAKLTVTGTPGGTGCLWFDGLSVTAAPRGVGAVATRYEPAAGDRGSCVRVEPGQRVEVTVAARPEAVRNGLVAGKLRVLSTGADPGSRTIELPVRFEMQHPPDVSPPALFAVLMAAGVLLPLGVLWLLNWFTARFSSPGLLRRAVKTVRVTSTGLVPVDQPWSPSLARDFTALTPPNADAPVVPCRSFVDHELHFRARVPVLPLRLPFGSVQAVDRDVLSSGGVISGQRGDHRQGRVPLGMFPAWVFVVEEIHTDQWSAAGENREVVGRLFLYITEEDTKNKAARLLAKAAEELPAVIAQLGSSLRPAQVLESSSVTQDNARLKDDDIFFPPA